MWCIQGTQTSKLPSCTFNKDITASVSDLCAADTQATWGRNAALILKLSNNYSINRPKRIIHGLPRCFTGFIRSKLPHFSLQLKSALLTTELNALQKKKQNKKTKYMQIDNECQRNAVSNTDDSGWRFQGTLKRDGHRGHTGSAKS